MEWKSLNYKEGRRKGRENWYQLTSLEIQRVRMECIAPFFIRFIFLSVDSDKYANDYQENGKSDQNHNNDTCTNESDIISERTSRWSIGRCDN